MFSFYNAQSSSLKQLQRQRNHIFYVCCYIQKSYDSLFTILSLMLFLGPYFMAIIINVYQGFFSFSYLSGVYETYWLFNKKKSFFVFKDYVISVLFRKKNEWLRSEWKTKLEQTTTKNYHYLLLIHCLWTIENCSITHSISERNLKWNCSNIFLLLR